MNLIESAGCSKLVDAIQKRCADSDYFDFMEVDLFLTWGLCVKHLADWCSEYIDEVRYFFAHYPVIHVLIKIN